MSAVDMIIEPRVRDLGGFTVGRILPAAKRRMVGPFIFFDAIGPADFEPRTGVDVRPHPHIGLATVTYLFEGGFRHRDSLGFNQVIRPGDVNWMTAGRGIVHSERTGDVDRAAGHRLHGVQSWVALPDGAQEVEPEFHHHAKASLPAIENGGLRMRLIAGTAFGETSPVKTFSPIFYLDAEVDKGGDVPLPDDHDERALFIVSGAVMVDGEIYESGRMIVFKSGATPSITVNSPSRLMLLGGAPVGERLIWWNLVSSSQARIDKAKADWKASAERNFADTVFTLPPEDDEHIPPPED